MLTVNPGNKIASGSAEKSGAVWTLNPKDGGSATVTADPNTGMTDISGSINFNGDSASTTMPGTVTPKPEIASVTINPTSATIAKGATQQFTHLVSGKFVNQNVNWSIVETGTHAGTAIDASGLLTVNLAETLTVLTVKVAATDNAAKSATARVTLTDGGTPPPPVAKTIVINDYNETGSPFETEAGTKYNTYIVPADTTYANLNTAKVAESSDTLGAAFDSGTKVLTIPLKDSADTSASWTGEGTYDVWIIPDTVQSGNEAYCEEDVSITTATTTIVATAFTGEAIP